MSKMTVHPRAVGVHRCGFGDEGGKPTTRAGRKAEKRSIKRRERAGWKADR